MEDTIHNYKDKIIDIMKKSTLQKKRKTATYLDNQSMCFKKQTRNIKQ